MVDTIILTLIEGSFEIINPDAFTPSAQWALGGEYKLRDIRSKQNPTKQELAAGIYKPRLTLFQRAIPSSGIKTLLKIELSLPKMFFGNNFEEFTEKQFPDVVQKLSTQLHMMGVVVDVATLAQAPVSVIHFSKNIPLTDGSIPYHYISKIEQANITLSLDVNQTDYRNKGHSYKWHSNAYELVFYDKIRDLEHAQRSDKRSMEKDNAIQMHLCERLQNRKKFELLRMEIRLKNRRKIQHLLKKLEIKAPLTFKGLFKTTIARKVLMHYLDEVERARPPLVDFKTNNTQNLLVALLFNNPDLSMRRIMQLYGMKMALEHISIRELRTMFGSYNKRSWYRLVADMKDVQLTQRSTPPNPFLVIRDCLEKFKAVERTVLY